LSAARATEKAAEYLAEAASGTGGSLRGSPAPKASTTNDGVDHLPENIAIVGH
jgi:hypothetical protein